MEKKSFIKRNKRPASIAGVAALGMASLVACANTDGSGNGFEIKGRVLSVGNQSVILDGATIDVLDQHGDAKGWFQRDGNHQVHDNYRDCGFGLNVHTVGKVVAANSIDMPLAQIQAGDSVELDGRIRDSYDKCGKYSSYSERAVFSVMTDESRN